MSNTSFTSENAASILELATGRPTVGDALTQILSIMRDNLDAELIHSLNEWKTDATPSGYGYNFSSAMKGRYHPHPQFFYGNSEGTIEQLNWLHEKVRFRADMPTSVDSPADANKILEIRDALMALVGAIKIKGFVKTSAKPDPTKSKKPSQKAGKKTFGMRVSTLKESRETATAKFEMLDGKSATATKATLPAWSDKYQGDYFRALSFAAEFAGRVHLWYDAWLRSQAMLLAKVGLLHIAVSEYREELSTLPLTCLFLALASAEFGKRKEFTLQSQKQGGLNPHLFLLLDKVKKLEPLGLRFIAYMLPAKEIWDLTPVEDLEKIHSLWMTWMPILAVSLEEQWNKGVSKSARREMRVLPGAHNQKCGKCAQCTRVSSESEPNYMRRYISCAKTKPVSSSGVNSSLWNVTADAWQNGSRVLRGLDLFLHKPAKFWGKTLQLIANDQYQMGQSSSKTMDPNVEIFDKITRAGVLPWRVAHPNCRESFDSVNALSTLLRVCSETMVLKDGISTPFSPNSWIGIPQLRKAEVTVHHNLICGCPVPPMPPLVFEWISTVLQPFGATGWTGN